MWRRPSALRKLGASAAFIRAVRNWPEYYAAAYGIRRGPRITYRLRNGLRFEARPRTLDAAVLKEVFIDEVYTPPGFGIEAGQLVVDVGAHIGLFACYAAIAARDVTVLAFEPCPENFALLTRNVSLNGLANIRVSSSAISGRAGLKELHLSSNPAGHSFHFVEPAQRTLTVPTLALADVLEAHRLAVVDLLKMDCEGDEYEILTSSAGGTLGRVRRIAMEAHRVDHERAPEGIQRFLEEQGFTVRIVAKGDGTAMLWATRSP